MRILGLADDMTGALEIGAKFAAAGIGCVVSARPNPARAAPVVVFDTETRHLSPEHASAEVQRFVGTSQPRLVYKKTDSTLRGNISAELRALAGLFPDWRIGYAPAYPALGRTVKNGILYVDGVPVAETAFANDPLNPIRSSSISSMLDPELPCTIYDGATDADLVSAAEAILSDDRMRIAAGPAGLAGVIAQQIDAPRSSPPPLPSVRSCLVMNGSLHPQAALQVQHLGTDTAWKILQRSYPAGAEPAAVAQENARYLLNEVAASAPDAVLVIGGDTAFAVVAALGLPILTPIGEVVPGVPISRIGDLLLITKAGGFGSTDVLRRIRALLDTDDLRNHNR